MGGKEIKMTIGKCYQHVANVDVAIQIISVDSSAESLKIRGRWWNVSSFSKNRWFCVSEDLVTIAKKDLANWEEISLDSENQL